MALGVGDGNPPCGLCGGPHPFDTVLPNDTWNAVIRGRDLPDYLCLPCIVIAMAQAGVGFEANIFSDMRAIPTITVALSHQPEPVQSCPACGWAKYRGFGHSRGGARKMGPKNRWCTGGKRPEDFA